MENPESFGDLPKPTTPDEEKESVEKFNLTNNELMRYRLSGELPERAAEDLQLQYQNQITPSSDIKHKYSKIIGGTDKERERVEKKLNNWAQRDLGKKYSEYEVIPTQEEEDVIESAVIFANNISKSYGGRGDLSTNRVLLIRSGSLNKIFTNKRGGAYARFYNQIFIEKTIHPISIGQTLVHEATHALGYHAVQLGSQSSIHTYRGGITMSERNINSEHESMDYFAEIEEALCAEISYRYFMEQEKKDVLFQEEIKRSAEIKKILVNIISMHEGEENKQEKIEYIETVILFPYSKQMLEILKNKNEEDSYKIALFKALYNDALLSGELVRERLRERRKFNSLLEEIVSKSNGGTTKEELFDDFARAHFSGAYLPLARKVEEIMGKGSFRKIAENFKEINKLN